MAMFYPHAFVALEEVPQLLGGLGQDEMADTFAAVFGTRWRRTPVKGTYALLSDGVQFTCRKLPCGGLDIGMYNYETGLAFRDAFNRKETIEPYYFSWSSEESNTKYPYQFLIEKMQEVCMWRPLAMIPTYTH